MAHPEIPGVVALAFATAIAQTTHADEPAGPAPVSRTQIGEDLGDYYGGERRAAFIVGGLSVASVGAGAVLVTRESDFARGLGWPLLTLGALEAIGAVAYAVQVGAEIDHYGQALAHDPAAFKREELAHIQGTTSRFVVYRAVEGGLTLAGAGVAIYGFAADRDVWKGIGIGVAAVALPFFVIDSFNQAHASHYQDHLSHFEPTLAVQPGFPTASERSWVLTVGGVLDGESARDRRRISDRSARHINRFE